MAVLHFYSGASEWQRASRRLFRDSVNMVTNPCTVHGAFGIKLMAFGVYSRHSAIQSQGKRVEGTKSGLPEPEFRRKSEQSPYRQLNMLPDPPPRRLLPLIPAPQSHRPNVISKHQQKRPNRRTVAAACEVCRKRKTKVSKLEARKYLLSASAKLATVFC
jgi:hypothetical protein